MKEKKNQIKFKQYAPAYCDITLKEYTVNSLDELLEKEKHKLLGGEVWATNNDGDLLMVSYTTKREWWVIGFVSGIDLRLYLPHFEKCYKGEKNVNKDN